jgi:hypothetical protein
MKVRDYLVPAIALTLAWSGWAVAADFDTGMRAYRQGDYSTAWQEWKPLADEGIPEAQYGLAVMFENGHGVQRDEAKAFDWFLKAAEQGDANAQFMVAVYYGRGTVVENDPFERIKWYHKAAEQGHAPAQVFLAMTYKEGRDAPKDDVLAYLWASRATENAQGEMAVQVEKLIEQIAAGMTPEQIEEGERRLATIRNTGEVVENEHAAAIVGSWTLRINVHPVNNERGWEAFNEFAVTFDRGENGSVRGTIRDRNGNEAPLSGLRTNGTDVSFKHRAGDFSGTFSDDGAEISGLFSIGELEYACIMSRPGGGEQSASE